MCQSNVCLNGGTCEIVERERSFRCVCMDGYSGILCESICDRSCKNAGQCVIENGISRCVCPKGLGFNFFFQGILF